MNEANCAKTRLLREESSSVPEILEKAFTVTECIEDKLFGIPCANESCEKQCPPNTVQSAVDRSIRSAQNLLKRLEEINGRI